MRDQMNELHPKVVIKPSTGETDTTASVGAIVDRQGYDSLTYLIAIGTLADADATFTVLLEEGDESDLSDNAAVADTDLVGTEALAAFTFADDGEARKLGYIGIKRYTRLTITPVANASAAPICAIAVLGNPHITPTANPPE